MNKTHEELNEEDLNEVGAGLGMVNPVAGMPFDQAFEIARSLGQGTYRGTWETMGAVEFMEWWKDSNPGVSCPIDIHEFFG